jgi:hypothetical protein
MVQADIAEHVNDVTPVAAVQEILRGNRALARNGLIFPTEGYTADCTFEPVLDGEQGHWVTEAFEKVVNAP